LARNRKKQKKTFEEILAAIQDPQTAGAFYLADGTLGDPEDRDAPSLDVKFVMCRTSKGEDKAVALMLDDEVQEFISEAIEVATEAEPDDEDEDEDEEDDGNEDEDEEDDEDSTYDL
jgi:hypothetical protein